MKELNSRVNQFTLPMGAMGGLGLVCVRSPGHAPPWQLASSFPNHGNEKGNLGPIAGKLHKLGWFHADKTHAERSSERICAQVHESAHPLSRSAIRKGKPGVVIVAVRRFDQNGK